MNIAKQQPHFNRRARTQKEIKQLIAERNNVLSQFYNLTNYTDAYLNDDIEELKERLQDFCQVMVDYIATGHFEIYQRIEEGIERRNDLIELSNQVYGKIIDTTKTAINFNDLYELSDELDPDNLKKFPKILSDLGENLAVRIELEDQYINILLNPKPQLVYSATN